MWFSTFHLGNSPCRWLLNRFQPASNQGGATPFELKFERRDTGKLVPFGSSIFARSNAQYFWANLRTQMPILLVPHLVSKSPEQSGEECSPTELKTSCQSKACLGTLPKKHLVSRSSTGRCPLCQKMRPSWTKRPRL